jgi:hypothetical protein
MSANVRRHLLSLILMMSCVETQVLGFISAFGLSLYYSEIVPYLGIDPAVEKSRDRPRFPRQRTTNDSLHQHISRSRYVERDR